MIDLLQGELAIRGSDHVVVLCAGVGYRAAVSAQTLRRLPPQGETVTLNTHLISREDTLTLYGFHSLHERELFQMLLTVQAVGPKVALAVLSVTPPEELVAVLAAGDADRLRAVPGIGKRTAERIIVELREKVAPADPGGPARVPLIARRGRPGTPLELARAGLVELGYAPDEADELLADADGDSPEELISGALRLARAGA
ncbi:MAG TPA: Holliday junction branch migration protein RuvA [Solirubrobacteraceae bacterium]|nr:Holliday junction branch migration protein RuvA [Solirubrobacteraceae bacterium]